MSCSASRPRGWPPGPGWVVRLQAQAHSPPPPTVPTQNCFTGNGTEYRGVASTAASGLGCLAWNSDLLYQELHVDSVAAAALLGLGPHAYCRSALARPARGHLTQGGQGLSQGEAPGPSAPARRAGLRLRPTDPRPPCPRVESRRLLRVGMGGVRGPTLPGIPFPSPCFPARGAA